MLIEGRGTVAPAPVRVQLTPGDVELVRAAADQRNRYRGYKHRRDAWGRGLISDPAFVGLAGELGVIHFLNRRAGCSLELDTELRPKGDGGKDIEVAGLTIQVKTRVTGRRNLIKRIDEQRRILGMHAGVFVFTRWAPRERVVYLLGWVLARVARARGHQEKGRGDWFNLRVRDRYLVTMSRLIAEIELRRAA